MKGNLTSQDTPAKKRKLFDSPAVVSDASSSGISGGKTPQTPYCEVNYEGISLTPCGALTDDRENIENTSPALRRLLPLPSRKSPHSPVHITSDGRFEKPTAFISPISRTMAKASRSVQVNSYATTVLDKHPLSQPFLMHFIWALICSTHSALHTLGASLLIGLF